ncbi:MAG: cytidine deaminase [Paludibacteraceae bacterium]|nr:cytidine deaminase [Paludibacteraceae bacterium]
MAIHTLDKSNTADISLIEEAVKATAKSYAPYSNFHVGAAVLMADGTVYSAANQENSAYPASVCAERVTLLYATANSASYPVAIAIAAKTGGSQTTNVVSPCGECRQVLREMELRYKHNIRILMCGKSSVMVADSAADLLPCDFNTDNLHP